MKINEKGIVLRLKEEHGVRYEKIEEYSQSLFRNVYYEAFVNTKKLINVNETYKGANPWEHDRLYNIITFWGPRGMGKTSVLRSFLGALDNFDDNQYKKFWKACETRNGNAQLPTAEEMKEYEFVCMECIDASLLDENEDIFRVILAKMLGEFLKKISRFSNNKEWIVSNNKEYFRYRKEDIVAKFEKIYIDLQNLQKIQKEHATGIGAVEILRSLSGSLDLRENFKELVPLYLEVMGKQDGNKKRFLVISIDDLDLKLQGYDILEQIHRYFMIPDVLIYITVAEAEVLAMCNRHFEADKVTDTPTRKQREELAKSYIDKVLPFANRIYMPTLFSETDSIKISPDEASIKETMLGKIARRTEVYFDGCGKKQHFYEATHVRTLVNLWCLLSRMQVLEHKCSFFTYQSNIDSLMNDISNRLTMQKLNGEQRQAFSPVSLMSIERQGVTFLQRIIKLLNEKYPKGAFTEDYEKYGYSYGELLRGLYTLGREYREEKPFVQCVLALETVGLTNLYNVSRMINDAKTSKDRLLSCFGGSICGSWGNKLVPKVKKENGGKTSSYTWGYIKAHLAEKTHVLYFDKDVELGISEDEAKKQAVWSLLEDPATNFVQMLELLSFFTTEWKNIEGSNRFCCQVNAKQMLVENTEHSSGTPKEELGGDNGSFNASKDKKTIAIGYNKAIVTFDILGFVVNCMRYEDVLKKVERELVAVFTEILGDEQEEKIQKIIEASSLKNEFKIWENEYGYMALPAYSTDMIYNVLKRAKRKNEHDNPATVSLAEVTTYLKKAYENIRVLLEEEDNFYNKLREEKHKPNSKKCDAKFAMTLFECPFVKKIQEDEYSSQFGDALQTFVEKIMIGEQFLNSDDVLDV